MSSIPLRIGLTGGIASGKSAVAEEFAALGIPIHDADVIARELVAPGQPALQRIVELLGPESLDAHGLLDRRRMRERVFGDPEARRLLESILHPAVRAELARRSEATAGPYQILVIPLLFENDLRFLVDRVLVVDVPEQMQMDRLMARDGLDDAQARRMLAAQTTRESRLGAADDVIVNTGSRGQLKDEVNELHRRYLATFRSGELRPGAAE